MNPIEIEEALQSFTIIVDTREQITPKAEDRLKAFGVPSQRATLSYGDYCGNAVVPGRGLIHDVSTTISAPCVIERKMGLDELASCFTRGRDRFRREFERAASCGAKVYLLVENASWEAIENHRYRSKFNPAAFKGSLVSWMVRYSITPVFCKSGYSGVLIKEILYRDMKERLERGEYG